MAFKVQKVVMLPTNQKAAVGMLALYHNVYKNTEWFLDIIHEIRMQEYRKVWTRAGLLAEGPDARTQAKYHHLYVTSDEPVVKSDWYLDADLFALKEFPSFNIKTKEWKSTPVNCIQQCDDDELANSINKRKLSKKIIATTDKTLGINLLDEAFALDFRDYYNNNNFATEAIVESVANMSNSPYTSDEFNGPLKALKESSGIGCKFKIKHPKTNWNKAELLEEFLQCNRDLRIMRAAEIRKWVEENL